LFVVLARLGQQLLARHHTGFRVLVGLDKNHYAHAVISLNGCRFRLLPLRRRAGIGRIDSPVRSFCVAVLYTVGHSIRPLPELIGILQEAGVARLADVRRLPRSRRHPQFNIDTLPADLAAAGIEYVHLPHTRRPPPPSTSTCPRSAAAAARAAAIPRATRSGGSRPSATTQTTPKRPRFRKPSSASRRSPPRRPPPP